VTVLAAKVAEDAERFLGRIKISIANDSEQRCVTSTTNGRTAVLTAKVAGDAERFLGRIESV